MSPARRRLLPWLALAVVYLVWGSTYMAIRIVVREMPPLAAAALRFFVAGVVMAGLAAVVDRRQERPSRRALLDYSLVGILLLAGGNGLVMWAETRVPSGIAALIVASVPLWLTLFDGLRRGGQPWTPRVWTGTALGLLGAAVVARPHGGATGHWLGVAGLQAACLFWTAGTLYAQSVRQRLPVFTASAVEMVSGSVVLLLVSRLVGEPLAGLTTASRDAWLALAYLALFGSLLAFTCFAYCINELPATTVGTYAYVNPVVAVVLGAIFLHEPLSPGLVVGALLILAALLLTTRGRTRRDGGDEHATPAALGGRSPIAEA